VDEAASQGKAAVHSLVKGWEALDAVLASNFFIGARTYLFPRTHSFTDNGQRYRINVLQEATTPPP